MIAELSVLATVLQPDIALKSRPMSAILVPTKSCVAKTASFTVPSMQGFCRPQAFRRSERLSNHGRAASGVRYSADKTGEERTTFDAHLRHTQERNSGQFTLRENGEEKHWCKKILEQMPEDDSSSV